MDLMALAKYIMKVKWNRMTSKPTTTYKLCPAHKEELAILQALNCDEEKKVGYMVPYATTFTYYSRFFYECDECMGRYVK